MRFGALALGYCDKTKTAFNALQLLQLIQQTISQAEMTITDRANSLMVIFKISGLQQFEAEAENILREFSSNGGNVNLNDLAFVESRKWA